MKLRPNNFVPLSAAIVALFILRVLDNIAGTALYPLFAFPSSKAAALFYKASLSMQNGVYCISDALLVLHITRQCSAFSFFSILFSLLLYESFRFERRRKCMSLLSALPLSYVLTICSNAVRIILWRAVYPFIVAFLPAKLFALAHQFTGIIVFLPLLCGVYYFAEKGLPDETKMES